MSRRIKLTWVAPGAYFTHPDDTWWLFRCIVLVAIGIAIGVAIP